VQRIVEQTTGLGVDFSAATYATNVAPTTAGGALALTRSFTPLRAGNVIKVHSIIMYGINNARDVTVALFAGSTCIGAGGDRPAGGGAGLNSQPCAGEHVAPSTAAITFTTRIGVDASTGTARVNGDNTGAVTYGAAPKSFMVIEEYDPS
jgi:hypothetical protein